MKIALVRKNYTPYGGAENYLRLVAGELAGQGHEIEIFTAAAQPDDTFTVHAIRTPRKPSFLSNSLFAAQVMKALQKASPDSIVSFERTYYQDIYRAGDGCHKEWLKKRTIIEPLLRKLSFSINPHHRVLLSLEQKCFQASRSILANSEMVKNDIVRNYAVPPEKISVIYNGVDTNRFKPVEKEKKDLLKHTYQIEEERVVLFVGADFLRKGLQFLFRAFAQLDPGNMRLIVAGRTAKARHIKMAEELKINNKVTFWGPEKKIEQLYAMADVFVLPTIYDPFSNATLEAMSAGLPVITTPFNGVSETIENGVQGFIVDPQDTDLLAKRILFAAEDSEGMGRRARIAAEGMPIENAVSKITDLIVQGDSPVA